VRIDGKYGGSKGGRNPRLTFNPSFPPGLSQADYLRQLVREYPRKVTAVGAGGGRSSGASENEGSTPAPPVFTVAQFTVADGGNNTHDFGPIAAIGKADGWYTFKRTVAGAPAYERGTFTIAHDGTNAEIGATANVVLPSGTYIGILLSGSIVAGELTLTATDDVSSGNITTVELVFFTRPPL
jgi:hypothetical protein